MRIISPAFILITISIQVYECALFVGVAKSVGDDGLYHVTFSNDGKTTEFIDAVSTLVSDQERNLSEPLVGVSAWNPVEKITYSAAAEDGYASSYLSPFDAGLGQTLGQRAIQSSDGTAFTLTSINYNRVDAKVYGMVTFQSGSHALVRIVVDTSETIEPGTVPYIIFEIVPTNEDLVSIGFTHIVPTLTALDPQRQVVYFVCVNETGWAFLIAHSTGLDPLGNILSPQDTKILWHQGIPGVLTSLQIDTDGSLYGMLFNSSGHILHRLAGACLSVDIESCAEFSVPQYGRPGDFRLDPASEVAFGIASFAPTQEQGVDPTYNPFSVTTEKNVTPAGNIGPALNRISLITLTLGNSDPLVQHQRNTSIRSDGLTLVSVEQSFATLPSIEKLSRSTAEISGGLLLTIYGGPFVDTKSNIQCRWRYVNTAGAQTSVLSSTSYFRSTSAVVCETPVLTQAARTKLDLTISGGATWTLDVLNFTFFQITSASPVVSCAKAYTAVEIKGLLLQDLGNDVVSGNFIYNGENVELNDIIRNSACEFGPTPVFQLGTDSDDGLPYSWESQGVAPGLPPVGPERCADQSDFCVQGGSSSVVNESVSAALLFKSMAASLDGSQELVVDAFGRVFGPRYLADSCTPSLFGLTEELICSLVCYAPPMPSVACADPSQASSGSCNTYVQNCPSNADSSSCLQLLPLLTQYDFKINFQGQRVSFRPGWSYDSSTSPVVIVAGFLTDLTGIYIQFDVDTNLAGNGDGVSFPAVNCFENSDELFGVGAYLLWRTTDVVYALFGPGANMTGASVTTESMMQIQVNSIALAQNQWQYAEGMFMLEPPSVSQIGRSISAITAPADVDGYETFAYVDGSSSGKYGGRWMSFAWGLRAEKCIDLLCINRLSVLENNNVWILPAQNQAFQSNASSIQNIKSLLLVGVAFSEQDYSSLLRLFSGNVIVWSLQTSNFFTNAFSCNQSCRYSNNFHGFTSVLYNADCCASLSSFATASTKIRCVQGPKITIYSPSFVSVSTEFPLSIASQITLPCCSLIQSCDNMVTCLPLMSVEWTVDQIVLQSFNVSRFNFWQQREAQTLGLDNSNYQRWAPGALPFTQVGVIDFPPFFFDCERYYRISLSVQMIMDNTVNETRTASFILYVSPQVPSGVISIQGFNSSLMTSFTFNTFDTFLKVNGLFEGLGTLPTDDDIFYNWTCLEFPADETNTVSDQEPPTDLKYTTVFRYWEDDKGMTNTPFFQNKVKESSTVPFTYCDSFNRSAGDSELLVSTGPLDSSKVYMYVLEVKLLSPRNTQDSPPPLYASRMGFTFLKSYGNDLIEYSNTGLAVQINIAAMYNTNPYKVVPGQNLAITGSVDSRSLASKPFLPRLDGSPGCTNCFFLWQELSKQYLFDNPVVQFQGIPGPVYLSIPASAVTGDNLFLVRLTLLEVRDVLTVKGYADLYLSVNAPPRGGHIEVSPSFGFAIETYFNLSALRWDDSSEDLPLQYAFSYQYNSNNDPVFLSDYVLFPTRFELFPLPSSLSTAVPCGENIFDLPCAVATVIVNVKDVWGGVSQSSVNVQVYLNSTFSCTYTNICNLFNAARQNGFLSLNMNDMINGFENILALLDEPQTISDMHLVKASEQTNCPTSASFYRSFILNTTLQFLQFQNGSLVPRSPVIITKITFIMTACLTGLSIDQETFDSLQSAITTLTTLGSGSLQRPSRTDIQTRLNMAGAIVRRYLAPVFVPHTNRRLLDSASNDAIILNSLNFVQTTIESSCTDYMGLSDPLEGEQHFTESSGLFSVSFRRVLVSGNNSVTMPSFSVCSASSTVIQLDISAPIFFCGGLLSPMLMNISNAKSGYISDQDYISSRQSSTVPWPLNPGSCPVLVSLLPMSAVMSSSGLAIIKFQVPGAAAFKVLPSVQQFAYGSLNSYYTGVCEQWLDSFNAWTNQGATTVIDGLPDFCAPSNETVPSFNVICSFQTLSGFFGVITEKTDCFSVLDTPDRVSAIDVGWQNGQFAGLDPQNIPSERKICDQCGNCGGYGTECALSCDGSATSGKTLDICGVCGGDCTQGNGCSSDFCPLKFPYIRYLGQGFPMGSRANSAGDTLGKLAVQCPSDSTGTVICKQIPSPSIVKQTKMNFIVQYPFNDDTKECWENSQQVPRNSVDSICSFEYNALVIDDKTQKSWQLDITAYDNDGKSSTSQGNFLLSLFNSTKSVLEIQQAFINNGGFQPAADGTDPNVDFLVKQQMLIQLMVNIIGTSVFATNKQPQEPDISGFNELFSYLCGILKADPVCSTSSLPFLQLGSPDVNLAGISSNLMSSINMIQFIPPPHWNSKYPPKRQSKIQFQIGQLSSVSALPVSREKNISVILYPVNDPPMISAPENYTVQEDKPNLLAFPSPIAIIDDADDVTGGVVDVVLSVRIAAHRSLLLITTFGSTFTDMTIQALKGGLAVGSNSEFSRELRLSGTLSHINHSLAALQYMTPENSNDRVPQLLGDKIFVTVYDNGSGGLAPYNVPFNATAEIHLLAIDENDAPVCVLPFNTLVVQNASSIISGTEILDVDLWEYAPSTYKGLLSASEDVQGLITVQYLTRGCNLIFDNPAGIFKAWSARFFDSRDPAVDLLRNGSTFLKLDGRPTSTKYVHLAFNLSQSIIEYIAPVQGIRMILSIYKHDCYDPDSDNGTALKYGSLNAAKKLAASVCRYSGQIFLNLVSCDWTDSAWTVESLSDIKMTPILSNISKAQFTQQASEWIDFSIDLSTVSPYLVPSGFCLQLIPDTSMNETQRYIAPSIAAYEGTTVTAPISRLEEDLTPSLTLISGNSVNISLEDSSSYRMCNITVGLGTLTRDNALSIETDLETFNYLIADIEYRCMPDLLTNLFGNSSASLEMSVWDVGWRQECIRKEALYPELGNQACYEAQNSSMSLLFIPLKKQRVNVHMQPYYAKDQFWLSKLSSQGQLPIYAQFEDCGNRRYNEECPSYLEVIPDPVFGEYLYAGYIVELYSTLGTFSVPQSSLGKLQFIIGDGNRDTVMRFTAKYVYDIRDALKGIRYHTPLDSSVQFENSEYYLLCNTSSSTGFNYDLCIQATSTACSRPCFFSDIGGAAFYIDSDPVGCEQGCSKAIAEFVFAKRANKGPSSVRLKGNEKDSVFLDDIVITFVDGGATGLGDTSYTTVISYSIYTAAANDAPCVIFQDLISENCRQNCANSGPPINCYNAGLPYDIYSPIEISVYENQATPINVGNIVVKSVDEYESTDERCINLLSQQLNLRGLSALADWVSLCPVLNVMLSATYGTLILNSRENIEIYLGSGSQSAQAIGFLGYPQDVNVALRMIRFQTQQYFNGLDTITIEVNDQGFSGSDRTGQVDGSSNQSIITIPINVIAVDNPPIITVPRSSDFISINENVATQIVAAAQSTIGTSTTVSVVDVDSDECNGQITMTLQVTYGMLFLQSTAYQNWNFLSTAVQNSLKIFEYAECSEYMCQKYLDATDCSLQYMCLWKNTACNCKTTKPGKLCSQLKVRGPQEDMQEALNALTYVPAINSNYYMIPDSEVLQIAASDKVLPEDPNSTRVSCGITLTPTVISWVYGDAYIRVLPVSQPCIARVQPLAQNSGFEVPAICEGSNDCDPTVTFPACSGILLLQNGPDFGWNVQGRAGITFAGLQGVGNAPEGNQNLYLIPELNAPVILDQIVGGFIVGANYKIIFDAGTPTLPEVEGSFLGIYFNLSSPVGLAIESSKMRSKPIWSPSFYQSSTFPTGSGGECTIWSVNELQSKGSIDFESLESAQFTADRMAYFISIQASLTPEQVLSGKAATRLILFDDFQIQLLSYNMLEDTLIQLQNVTIEDPDYNDAIKPALNKINFLFNVSVNLTVTHGVLFFETDECSVMPPMFPTSLQYLMKDDALVTWGLRCAAYYDDPTISQWANTSVALRSRCPPNWVGLNTEEQPCVNLSRFDGLLGLKMDFESYNPNLWPQGQTLIPSRSFEVSGIPLVVSDFLSTWINYQPDEYFNTNYMGFEAFNYIVNDQCSFDPAVAAGAACISPNIRTFAYNLQIYAVNNPPQISLEFPSFNLTEDNNQSVTGISVDDVDLDEIPCSAEPCSTGRGVLQVRISTTNGTINVSPIIASKTVLFDTLLDVAFENIDGIITTHDQRLCLMQLSCNPKGGFLTLALDTVQSICANNGVDSVRCKEVLQYCTTASMALVQYSNDECISILSSPDIYKIIQQESVGGQLGLTALKEQSLLDTYYATAKQSVILFTKPTHVVLIGTRDEIMSLLTLSDAFTFVPTLYLNGVLQVDVTVSDQGNTGIGFPCPISDDFLVSENLMFAYCTSVLPVIVLETTKAMIFYVTAVDIPPVIHLYNLYGVDVYGVEAVPVSQNVTTLLWRMSVTDVDVGETPDCRIKISMQTGSGGQIQFNLSLAPGLVLTTNAPKTSIQVEGTLDQVNTFLGNIKYTSDPKQIGYENLLITPENVGCIGENPPGWTGPQTFVVQILVSKRPTCQYATCEDCVNSQFILTNDPCGWCPSSCSGLGKCIDALSIRGPPVIGECPPQCVKGVCFGWNVCTPTQPSIINNLVIGPALVFLTIIVGYCGLLWVRSKHGTVIHYILKLLRASSVVVQKFSLAPKEDAKYLELLFLVLVLFLGSLLPGLVDDILYPAVQAYSLADSQSFVLQTDACTVNFIRSSDSSASVTPFVTANGTLQNVFLFADFCSDVHSISIVNNRDALVRYDNYICQIQILTPTDSAIALPAFTITNVGSESTSVTSEGQEMVLNFGSNNFILSGTILNVDLYNVWCRSVLVPNLGSGSLTLRNITFASLNILSTSADIVVTVSYDRSMLSVFDVDFLQSTNAVCLVSAVDRVGHNVIKNKCALQSVSNSSTGSKVTSWSCTGASNYVVMYAYKLVQDNTLPISVSIVSLHGQVYFQTIPESRTPPYSGIVPVDNISVYDGASFETTQPQQLTFSSASVSQIYSLFHPGGADRPNSDFLYLNLAGPSIPDGQFVWVSNSRYLVIEPWILTILSAGVLVPSTDSMALKVVRGLCPQFGGSQYSEYELASSRRLLTSSDEELYSANYLRQFFLSIFQAIDGANLAPGSTVAFKSQGMGSPWIIFSLDISTNLVSISQISLTSAPDIALLAMGTLFPVLVCLLLLIIAAVYCRKHLVNFRINFLKDQQAMERALDFSLHQPKFPKFSEPTESAVRDITAKTNFFYLIDCIAGYASTQKSLLDRLKASGLHLLAIACPIVPILVLGFFWQYAQFTYVCPLQSDVGLCRERMPLVTVLSIVLSVTHGSISIIELYSYYADLPYNKRNHFPILWRLIIRRVFYAFYFLSTFIGFSYLLVLLTWTFIGLLFNAAEYISYVTGVLMVSASIARHFVAINSIQKRVVESVTSKTENLLPKKGKFLTMQHHEIVDSLVKQQTRKFLDKRGVSFRGTVVKIVKYSAVLVLVTAFLWLSFKAFLDSSNIYFGIIKGLICAIIIIMIDRFVNGKSFDQDIELMVLQSKKESSKLLEYLEMQIDVGRKLVIKMKQSKPNAAEITSEELNAQNEYIPANEFPRSARAEFYNLHTNAAKNVILDDRNARVAKGRLQVNVGYEMSPMQRIVAADEGYGPKDQENSFSSEEQNDGDMDLDSQAGMADGADVVILLDELFFEKTSMEQLRHRLAQFLAISNDRLLLKTASVSVGADAFANTAITAQAGRRGATLGGGGGGGGG